MRPLLIVGTRPEAIKMAPVIKQCQTENDIEPIICFTGQHKEMLQQVADYFELVPDIDLDLMSKNQSLSQLTARCLEGLDGVIEKFMPDCVVAQGDTTTVLAASMISFYKRLPFVHVEAGLRTNNLLAPWPEEYNRRVASIATTLHCAPTERAAHCLRREGIEDDSILVTGNTVIDALYYTVDRERKRSSKWSDKYDNIFQKRLVLITGHRRENFGTGFESICLALRELSQCFPDTSFIYPVHLNPNVREPVFRLLADCKNVHLIEPVAYPEFVWLMDQSTFIITDSGGVQEEAPSLKKPVLLMRETTERPEAVELGMVKLVGTDHHAIVSSSSELLSDNVCFDHLWEQKSPYGDGESAGRIVDGMRDVLDKKVLNRSENEILRVA